MLPAAMEALMLILKVVLMMVKRVAPLMMTDGFLALSTLFFSFLVLRCFGAHDEWLRSEVTKVSCNGHISGGLYKLPLLLQVVPEHEKELLFLTFSLLYC
jgi:hypothetical protein